MKPAFGPWRVVGATVVDAFDRPVALHRIPGHDEQPWDPATADLIAAAPDLSAEVDRLRRELSDARAMAWGFQHRMWMGSWFFTGDNTPQPWQTTSVEPDQQDWWAGPYDGQER